MNIGVEIGPYDPARQAAGVFRFTKEPLVENRLFMDFGYSIANAAGGPKQNPQPTYILPRGTKVLAMIDGVASIHSLWSTAELGDYSVMISCRGSPEQGDRFFIEAEHVLPLVRDGDRVKAGQVIAEVGPLSSASNSGLYLVEIGILTGGPDGRPLHICPFAHLDSAVSEGILGDLRQLAAAWEQYTGDVSLYDEDSWVDGVPGCLEKQISEG